MSTKMKAFRPARSAAVLAAILALVACGAPGPDRTPEGAASQVVSSDRGMVVSAEPLATAAGVQVLEAGGNAVDAAVATAFALAVVEPSMSGIGGRNNMVIRTPTGDLVGIDGFTEVPAGYERREGDGTVGHRAIGIPGAVAGLAKALEEYGTLPLAQVMAPAIELAEEGYPLPEREARRMEQAAEEYAEHEEWQRIFVKPDGSTYAAGEHFRQPELASTLRAIAEEGPEVFYRGEIARRIAEDMEANDAHLTYDDLAAYQAIPAILVRGSYRGHDLVGTHLPASGVTSIQALQVMEQVEAEAVWGTPEWAAVTAQALAHAFHDRTLELGTAEEKASLLTSREWAAERAAEVRIPGPGVTLAEEAEVAHTTHLSTADAEGGMVALTASLGDAFGSRVVTPGLGFVWATTLQYTNVLPGTPRPRPMTSQSPLIVLRDGEPVLVLGAAGGRRIVSAVVSVVSRVLDEGLALPAAMDAPRVHSLGADRIELEHDEWVNWPTEVWEALEAFGYEASEGSAIARIHAIARDPATGELTGVADRRGSGGAGAPGR
jgi:gamma-glutamyltranspeptidase / glutathione hydrolase